MAIMYLIKLLRVFLVKKNYTLSIYLKRRRNNLLEEIYIIWKKTAYMFVTFIYSCPSAHISTVLNNNALTASFAIDTLKGAGPRQFWFLTNGIHSILKSKLLIKQKWSSKTIKHKSSKLEGIRFNFVKFLVFFVATVLTIRIMLVSWNEFRFRENCLHLRPRQNSSVLLL